MGRRGRRPEKEENRSLEEGVERRQAATELQEALGSPGGSVIIIIIIIIMIIIFFFRAHAIEDELRKGQSRL